MAKKNEKEKIKEMISISSGMVRNCKSAIAKFGFGVKEYEEFLQSVKAMRATDRTVMMYPVSDMPKYRDEFIQQHESSLADIFVFDKFIARASTESGGSYETGYFVPRSFWDYVMRQRT